MKSSVILSLPLLAVIGACSAPVNSDTQPTDERIVAAYTYHKDAPLPDPGCFNRVHYSYGAIDPETLTTLQIRNTPRLKEIVALKHSHPELKVTLSVGGVSGDMSMMARNDSLRAEFAASCVAAVDTLGLDGIDIDWEHPGRGERTLPVEQDSHNFALFLTELRRQLGDSALITVATSPSGFGIDFKEVIPVIDNFNIMTYDMGTPPFHHSALHRSDKVDWRCVDDALETYTTAGVPREMIVIGVPFYGRGGNDCTFEPFVDYNEMALTDGMTVEWDSVACVPYVTDTTGRMLLSFESPASLSIKCDYIIDRNLGGVMCWKYEADDTLGTLRNILRDKLLPHRSPRDTNQAR